MPVHPYNHRPTSLFIYEANYTTFGNFDFDQLVLFGQKGCFCSYWSCYTSWKGLDSLDYSWTFEVKYGGSTWRGNPMRQRKPLTCTSDELPTAPTDSFWPCTCIPRHIWMEASIVNVLTCCTKPTAMYKLSSSWKCCLPTRSTLVLEVTQETNLSVSPHCPIEQTNMFHR
jgi:hypothetical protein